MSGAEGKSEQSGVSLSVECSVCSSPAAAHLHYGAVSCYSCRAFFRRGQPRQSRCIFGHGQCKIVQTNRTNCKLCRYKKCLEVGMKPDKVDHYLNKRKEREARLANEEDHGQVPNRSPSSEELNIQTSPRNTTPSPVNKRSLDQISQIGKISPQGIKTNCYARSEDNEAQGNIIKEYPISAGEDFPRTMKTSQKYSLTNIEQRRYLSGSFQPHISPPQSIIASTRIPLWPGEGSHQENKRNNVMNTGQVMHSYHVFRDKYCSEDNKGESKDISHGYDIPHRTNQTSVIRYENNLKQETMTNNKIESFYKPRNNYSITSSSDEIKQEQTNFDDGNKNYESYLISNEFCQKTSSNFTNLPPIGYSKDNSNNFSPSYQQTSVIKRTPEVLQHKSFTHTITNFNQVEAPKPFDSMNEDKKHIDIQEIKSEESNVYDQVQETKDNQLYLNELFADSLKTEIFKRKAEEDEESNPDKDDKKIIPLKKRPRMLEIPYASGHAVNHKVLPVMSLTFEEEFKIADYMVRIEQYQNRRFEFISKNFPQYKQLMASFVNFKHQGRKIPFNRALETKLFLMGLEFTKQNVTDIYDEMREMSTDVRREVLNSTYPALYVVMYAILEGNTREQTWMNQHKKTLHTTKESHAALKDYITGLENVGSISLKDQERFTSPWAVEMVDEEKFEQSVSLVGRILRDDIQLQALYHMYVMVSPAPRTSDKTKLDPVIITVQSKLTHLIYRYLANKTTEYGSMKNNDSHQSSCLMDNNDFSSIITENSDYFSGMMKNNSDANMNSVQSSNIETKKSDHSFNMMTKNINHSPSTITKNSNDSQSMMDGKIALYNDHDIDNLSPSEKTRLLVNLVPHLHDCVDIMHNRSLIVQT